MQLKLGEMRLFVCGQLARCAPYQTDDGASGFAGQVDFLGGFTKFTADAELNAALQPFIGKEVQLSGVPKVAGDKGERGTLKIGKVLEASVDGRAIYTAPGAPASQGDGSAKPGIFRARAG